MRRVLLAVVGVLIVGAAVVLYQREVAGPSVPRIDREPVVEAPQFQPVDVRSEVQGLAVTGVVRDAAGNPVAGAQISLAAAEQPSLVSARCGQCGALLLSCRARPTAELVGSLLETHQGEHHAAATVASDAEGRFRFDGLKGASFTVWGTAAGHGLGVKDRAAPLDPVELYLPAPRVVSGRLVDEAGRALVGEVRVVSRRLAHVVTAKTDATGQFRVDSLGEGPFVVHATSPGRLPTMRSDVRAGAEPIITLVAPRRLEVRVIDAERRPVTATVRVIGDHLSREVVAEQGLAVLAGLPPVQVMVTAVAKARASSAQPVTLSTTSSITLMLEPAGTLAVSVVDERGEPAPRPEVELLTLSGEVLSRRLLETGALALLGPVAVGSYQVRARAEGSLPVTVPAQIVEGETPLELSLSAGFSISGRVLDEYGRPAPGVSVLVMPVGESTPSGDDGTFRANVPGPGLYSLQAHHSDWGGGERKVTAPATGVELQLEPRAGCAITVTSGGKRLEGAMAVLFTPEGSFRSDRVSGADGVVLMRGMPAGAYSLVVNHADYLSSERQPVTVDDGQLTRVSVELQAGSRVTGKVIDEHGEPIPQLAIALVTRPGEAVQTDATGTFSIGPLVPASVHVLRVMSRGWDQDEVISAVAGGSPVTLRLTRLPTFRGRVLGDGKPLKQFRVGAHEVTSSEGTFELPLPPLDQQRVLVTIDAPGFAPLTAERPRAADLGVFELRSMPTVTGVVRDEQGVAVAEVIVSCDSCEQSVLTGPDGRFALSRPFAQNEFQIFAKKGRRSGRLTVNADSTGPLEVLLRQGVRAFGTVWLSSGRPAGGVEVSALNAERNESLSAVTDAEGHWSMDASEGVFRFLVSGPGVPTLGLDPLATFAQVGPQATRVDFGPAPGTSTLAVTLKPRSGHALILVRGAVTVVGNPPLELLHAPWAQMLFQPSSPHVLLSGLGPGRYTLVWASLHGVDASPPRVVQVEVPSTPAVDLTLTPPVQPGGLF